VELEGSQKVDGAARDKRESIDTLLSLEDVMEILGIGRTLLYKQMSCGNLPWVQIGSTRHISRNDLTEFINRNRKGGRRVA
jgi:predicted DNA-binding transcriptional regulator AlpA